MAASLPLTLPPFLSTCLSLLPLTLPPFLSTCLSPSFTLPLSRPLHSHTLPITCTYCYDEIKGTQDQDLVSHARSLILSLYTHTLTHPHTLTITCTCCYDKIKGAQDQDLFACYILGFSLYEIALFLSKKCVCVAVIIERPGLVRGAVAGTSRAVRTNRSIRNSNGIVQEFL